MAKQNGEHSSGWEVERHKVEDGSVEQNATNVPGPPTHLTEVTKMSTVVQTDDLRSHNKSKVKDDVDVIQTDNAATIKKKNITRGANEFLLSRNRQELDQM